MSGVWYWQPAGHPDWSTQKLVLALSLSRSKLLLLMSTLPYTLRTTFPMVAMIDGSTDIEFDDGHTETRLATDGSPTPGERTRSAYGKYPSSTLGLVGVPDDDGGGTRKSRRRRGGGGEISQPVVVGNKGIKMLTLSWPKGLSATAKTHFEARPPCKICLSGLERPDLE